MVRNSHQDALTETEFNRLVKATDVLKPKYESECLFVLIVGGRLGMRAGEIAHLSESWINWNTNQIEIPYFDECDIGVKGTICGYCRSQAGLAVENGTYENIDQALRHRWTPKTEASARAIPFDFDPFIQSVIEKFFEQHDRYPHSRVSVNRRVDRVLEAGGYSEDKCYPHALRATAASFHAYRGLPAPALQSMFGWTNLKAPQKYLRLSGGATARALRDVHGD